MNSGNIMWYLNELDVNSNVCIKIVRSKSTDYIEIETDKFDAYIDEYGYCEIFGTEPCSDIELWKLVKQWCKKYLSEV